MKQRKVHGSERDGGRLLDQLERGQYRELQDEYLPTERDWGPERELIAEVGASKQCRILVNCYLHGLNQRVHRLPLEEAGDYVRNRNRVGKVVLNFVPSIWKRIFS